MGFQFNTLPATCFGEVRFTFNTKGEEVPEGTEVKNEADITFDTTSAITTKAWTNRYSLCLPEIPRNPIPEDTLAVDVEPETVLGWRSDNDIRRFSVEARGSS